MNTKRLKEELDAFNAENKKLKITFGTLVVMGWCVFLIIIATFTQLDFSHYVPGSLNPADPSFLKLKHCVYIPQIPVIFDRQEIRYNGCYNIYFTRAYFFSCICSRRRNRVYFSIQFRIYSCIFARNFYCGIYPQR